MRHILQGFTMFVDGLDYGIDTEEVELPFPTPVMQEYRGGGMDLAVNLPMAALEALEISVKISGQNPDIMAKMAQAPGVTKRIQFRGAILRELDGAVVPHICIAEGAINGSSRDRWQRGEKVGFEFGINSIKYLRYEADNQIIHEVQAWPPRRIINGINVIAGVNAALGY